jgi:hypothetical protein
MSARYTKTDVRNAVSSLSSIAKTVGILPADHSLVYGGGNISNGISATVTVRGPEGQYVHGYDRFIPEFTYKTTMREQVKLIDAVTNALYAVATKDQV